MDDVDEEDRAFALVVSFPDQSATFCHGFEAGQLWQRMTSGTEATIEATTRVENREVIRRCASALGWTVSVQPSEIEGWDFTTMEKVGPPPASRNPHGLQLIEGGVHG